MLNPCPHPCSSPCPSVAVRAALAHFDGLVAVATGMAETGRTVSLTGLEDKAGALCAHILDLPPADGALFRAPLAALDEKLATLAATIRAHQ